MNVDVKVGFSLRNVGVCKGLLCAWRKEHYVYVYDAFTFTAAGIFSLCEAYIHFTVFLFVFIQCNPFWFHNYRKQSLFIGKKT